MGIPKIGRLVEIIGRLAALQICLATASGAETKSIASVDATSGQMVVNAGGSSLAYLNLVHGISLGSAQIGWPGILTSDGYPSGTTTANITGDNIQLIPNYFGRYKILWTGSGNFQLSPQAIIYSGGSSVGNIGGGKTGSVPYNLTIGKYSGATTQPTANTPVEFAFGALISGVADSGAGLVRLTANLPTAFANVDTGSVYQINNIINLDGGPWTITKIDGQHIDLEKSSYNKTMAVIRGAIGIQSEAILSVSGATWYFLAGTFNAFGGMVVCRSGDVAAIMAGRYVNPDYVTTFKTLSPRFIRFMDYSKVIGNYSSSYSYRPKATQLSWGLTNQVSAYWGGALIGSGSDRYTLAANPKASPASGGFIDGEIVAGYISRTNNGHSPSLAIAGRIGSAPILTEQASLLSLTMTGAIPPSGTTISLAFTGGGLVNPFTYKYLTSTSAKGPGGVTDTSFGNIAINMRADINTNVRGNARPLVIAGIASANPEISDAQMTFKYNPNINSSGAPALGNGLEIVGSDSASSSTYEFGFLSTGYIRDGMLVAFTYSALASGWIPTIGESNGSVHYGGGTHGGPPLEFYEELCIQANVGMWWNIGPFYSLNYTYETVLHIAQSGVKELALEISNETWNFGGGGAAHLYQNLGMMLGLKYEGNESLNGFHGLQTIQMAQQARAAWAAAGRDPAKLYIVNAYQFVAIDRANRLNGGNLNPATNPTLATYGGPAATAISTNHSIFPNRPIDHSDLLSPAPYWRGGQYNAAFGGGLRAGLPLSAYNNVLVAAYNWVNGNPTQQAAALDFLFNSKTGHGDLYDGTLAGKVEPGQQLASWAVDGRSGVAGYFGIGKIAASYDTQRASRGLSVLGVAAYEGDFEAGPVFPNEVASVAASLTSLRDVSGYTSDLPGAAGGPLSNAETDARNLQALLAGLKNDARFAALYARYFKDFQAAVKFGGERIALPATYGFEGPSVWSKYPGSIYSKPYKSWNAIQAFDE